MTDKTNPISILFSSDHHFGSPSNSQQEMADAFQNTIFPLLSDTDIFFINGDFYDTLVIFDNHGFDPIYDTILRLFQLCDQHKVALRILQGTWTHDRNQCKRFEAFYRNSGYSFDFRFVDGIQLEEIYVRHRDLRFLYVQDDLPFKTSDLVVEAIKDKMVDVGWDHVDYACMHGFFDFTFPHNVSQDNVVVFRKEQFPFVKKLIDVGHVHQHRIQDNVISNGSFDRLNHADEDPKGLIRVFDYPDYYTAQFIENKQAAVYNTLVITKTDTTESIVSKINQHVASLITTRRISLRFIIETAEHREAIKTFMKETYPDVYLKFKKAGEAEEKLMIPSSELFTPSEKRIAPTPETIATFIQHYLPGEYPLSVDDINRYLEPPLL